MVANSRPFLSLFQEERRIALLETSLRDLHRRNAFLENKVAETLGVLHSSSVPLGATVEFTLQQVIQEGINVLASPQPIHERESSEASE